MIDRINDFLKKQSNCVLATVRQGHPHCSLMSYVTDPDVQFVYMVTHRNTSKYRNLLDNPNVSLLVDDRKQRVDKHHTCALTVHGTFQSLPTDVQQSSVRPRFLERHADMHRFIEHPETEFISIRIVSFLFLDGIVDAHYIEL